MRLDKIEVGLRPLLDKSIQIAARESITQTTRIQEETFNKDDVNTVILKLNGFIDQHRTNVQFKYHEELNEYYVTVINPLTNEVIKEIPPKKILDMYAAMVGFMGILIDEKI